jgi:hypothetical protein
MSTPTINPPQTPAVPPPAPPESRSAGRIGLGGVLVLLGLAWLADAAGIFDFRWQTVLAITVLGIGGLLLATARSSHDGLIALGIVLSVLLVFSSFVPRASFSSGAGDRTERPTTLAQIEDGYQLGAGKLTIDLRGLSLPAGVTELEANVGMGELQIRLPEGVAADITASAGMGEVIVLGRTQNGIGPNIEESVPGTEGLGRLVLDASAGMGKVEVTR